MPNDAINIDLEDLQEIMNKLPDQREGTEKRKYALTKDDVLIIAQVVQAVSHKSCAMGFEVDEIKRLKGFVRTVNGGILAIGYAILATIGAGLVSITIWAVKHGILEVVDTTKKGVGK